jgi:rod shape-determining protein MreD
VRYWVLTGLLLLAFLIQSVVADYLAIGGVHPDFLLVLVISYGLLFGWQIGLGAGALGGLLIDLMSGRVIGLHVLSLGVVGLLTGLVEERVFKDNFLLAPTAGWLGSILSHTMALFFHWLFGWEVDLFESFRTVILPAALYDMALAWLIYGQIYKYYLYLRPDPRGTIVLRRT